MSTVRSAKKKNKADPGDGEQRKTLFYIRRSRKASPRRSHLSRVWFGVMEQTMRPPGKAFLTKEAMWYVWEE